MASETPTLKDWWNLVRGPNLFLAFAGVTAGALAGAGPAALLQWWVLVAALGAVLITAGGNVLNDLGDIEVDRRNRPGRPLASGRIPAERIRGVPRAGFALGLLCAMAAGPLTLLVAVAAVASLSLYENRLKLGPAKNLPISIAVGLFAVAAARTQEIMLGAAITWTFPPPPCRGGPASAGAGSASTWTVPAWIGHQRPGWQNRRWE